MNALYNIGIGLYAAGVRLVSLRNPKARLMVEGRRETMARLRRAFGPSDRPIWIHASSLGEFEQGRPLIERLRREKPGCPILLTFFSPSGYEVRKNYTGADCVAYLPFDKPARVREFLDTVNPSVVIFVKYEFWGNMLSELARRQVPTYLISAIFRPGQIFFKPWGAMFRRMLRCFTHLYVQDNRSVDLLASGGITNVTVAGDTRFDRVTDILRQAMPLPVVERFCAPRPGRRKPFVLVAGSSWEPDEDVYLPWVNSHNDIKVIIAPHEFDTHRLDKLCRRIKGGAVLLSEAEADPAKTDGTKALIVDSFGKLSSIYRYGDVAYVGGGFGVSIHNINEAAVYSMPVVFGPRHSKFKEAADLMACGGGFEVTDTDSCSRRLEALATDTAALQHAGGAAGRYITDNLGATDLIYNDLFGHSGTPQQSTTSTESSDITI